MALDIKYQYQHTELLRDGRPLYIRTADWLMQPDHTLVMFLMAAFSFHFYPPFAAYADFIFIFGLLYLWWLQTRSRALVFRMPLGAKHKDPQSRNGKAKGILYLGNMHPSREEIWFDDSDARTHMLYLGTTGSGKTEGLKSMATNAMCWASGFVYIDGKADTDLWSSLSSLVRRFGRDDDLLVLNYMTGNSNRKAPSNSMNPFSTGSASYLTQMLVSLMPEAEGDNAMWKERAVSLLGALMPALTWKRDNQDIGMSVGTIRQALTLASCVKLSRDESLPEMIRRGLKGYLETLPGYVDAAFDDEGKDKPMGPDQPMIDTTTAKTQHGYLSMQFTRSLQSLADDYGYIFDSQAADVDMLDVVLNRRILVVLIPALEKSGDETANLGKIVAATLKGMMGSTLGATVEGEDATVIESKPAHSATPFITVFDEVGYYVSEGMAVMAAQARSLGFCLIFSAQDLPALQKRVKEESRSITGNCNIKIFGKLSDPTDTKDYFERQAGKALVMQTTGFQLTGGVSTGSFYDNQGASITAADRADYGDLKKLREGEAVLIFEGTVIDVQIFYSNPGHAKAMRVGRFLSLPPTDENILKHRDQITKLRDHMVSKTWTAAKADVKAATPLQIDAMKEGYQAGFKREVAPVEWGIAGIAEVHARQYPEEAASALSAGSAPAAGTYTGPSLSAQRAPEIPAGTATPPLSAPPRTAPAGSGPMGFFKKPGAETSAPATSPVAAPAVEPVRENKKVSWNDLIQEEAAKVELDKGTEKILETAGADLAAALFKKEE